MNDPRFERVPIVVETPDAEKEHARNVAALWACVEREQIRRPNGLCIQSA